MKKIFLLLCLALSLTGWSQHYIQASVQQGAAINTVNVNFLPNYTSAADENILYLSISVAIPTAEAANVNPTIVTKGPFNGISLIRAFPFSYTAGTETIYSWIYDSGPATPTAWVNAVEFTGATITFTGGAGSANVRLVDFTNYIPSGGDNINTLLQVVTNKAPYDVTNYSNFFYPIAGTNGSTTGVYPNGDQYVQTNVLINLSSSCPPPAIPVVDPIGATSAHIVWNNVSGALGYEYFVSTSPSNPPSGTATTAVIFDTTSLQIGTHYYFHIRTICPSGNVSGWSTASFTTLCPVTNTPVVHDITTTGASFDWTEIVGAAGYEFAVTPGSTGAPAFGTSTTSFINNPSPALLPGTLYTIYVRTECSPGVYSGWSNASFTTSYPPCNAPVSLAVSNSGSSATMNWSAVSGNAGYEYVISTSATEPVFGVFTINRTFDTTGLSSNTQYYVYVRTVCGPARHSVWVKQQFVTSCFKPSPFIVGNTPDIGTADLGWHKIPGGLNYEYAILSYAAPPAGSVNFTKDTIIRAANLIAGNKYYLHVRTHCGPASVSEWSVLEFHTSGISIYPNPANNIISITIYGVETQTNEIAIFDVSGKLLKIANVVGATTSINMGNYSAGVYFIRYGQQGKYMKCIIKL